jgi:hypothetical protein
VDHDTIINDGQHDYMNFGGYRGGADEFGTIYVRAPIGKKSVEAGEFPVDVIDFEATIEYYISIGGAIESRDLSRSDDHVTLRYVIVYESEDPVVTYEYSFTFLAANGIPRAYREQEVGSDFFSLSRYANQDSDPDFSEEVFEFHLPEGKVLKELRDGKVQDIED